jgi:hypothetical protein
MTIQQMVFSGSISTPEYVGFSQTSRSNVSSYTASCPSAAQAGDLVIFFGFAKDNNNATLWSINGITELQDSNADPNLYVGYKYVATAGETYSVLLNRNVNSTGIYAVAYRRVTYGSFAFIAPGSPSSASISITPTANNASVVGYVFNGNRGTPWAFTETAPSTTTALNTGSSDLLIKKDAVNNALTYTFTSLNNSNRTQAALVSLLPV